MSCESPNQRRNERCVQTDFLWLTRFSQVSHLEMTGTLDTEDNDELEFNEAVNYNVRPLARRGMVLIIDFSL